MIDLYTYNFAYLRTRAFGNDGGVFLIVGPGWSGPTPAGVKAVIHTETQFAYALFRPSSSTRPTSPNVNKIQSGLATPAAQRLPPPARTSRPPAVNWPKPADNHDPPRRPSFPIVNFLFQFCPPNPSESYSPRPLRQLGIGPAQTFDLSKFPPEIQQAINDGIKDSSDRPRHRHEEDQHRSYLQRRHVRHPRLPQG